MAEAFLTEAAGRLPGVSFANVWGLTEATSIVTCALGREWLERPWSVGRPVPGIEVAVAIDEQVADPDPDAVGELWVRGPAVTAGYWGRPEATAQTFGAVGWLRTGDIGRADAEGYVQVLDRMKDMIIRGGENIYSLEVESVIARHPAVGEVAVVGVPDTVFGERVRAVAVLREGASLSISTLREWAGTQARRAAWAAPATLELCRQGAAVVATDVDEAALKEVAGAVPDTPGSVHPQACDITDPDAPRLLLRTALHRYGQLHGLVSNAGLLRSGPILRLDDDDLRLLLDVHVSAAFRLLRVIGGYWRAEAKAGRAVDAAVVLTTSSAGLYGFRAEAAYSAAKAAVAMLARVGADELGRYGTTVNAIAPVARTRLTEWLGERTGDPAAGPLAAEHIAPVIAWLLRPGARDVTGRVLEAGNGHISVPGTCQPGPPFPLPPLMSPEAADALLPRVLASATPPPPALLTSLLDPAGLSDALR